MSSNPATLDGMSVKNVDVWEQPTPAGLDAPQPRPTGEDLFRSMTPEELAQFPGLSADDIQEAVEEGKARARARHPPPRELPPAGDLLFRPTYRELDFAEAMVTGMDVRSPVELALEPRPEAPSVTHMRQIMANNAKHKGELRRSLRGSFTLGPRERNLVLD